VADALAFFDEDGYEVIVDDANAASLWTLTAGLDAATVSACPGCRSRVLAGLAFLGALEEVTLHPTGPALVELAEEAPTMHLYLEDLTTTCRHPRWRDPGHAEWAALVATFTDDLRGRN
jgi:hypothetical protein